MNNYSISEELADIITKCMEYSFTNGYTMLRQLVLGSLYYRNTPYILLSSKEK
jgi:hypothetical protein